MYKLHVMFRLVAFAVALLAGQLSPWAQELQIALELTDYAAPATSECPSREVFENEIRELLGRDPFGASPEAGSIRVAVALREEGSGFSGTLQAAREDSGPERRFVATSCEELAATIALAVAIAVGPVHTAEPRGDEAPVDPEKRAKSKGETTKGPEEGARTTPSELALFVEPSVLWRTTPERNNALALGLALRRGSLSLHLRLQGSDSGIRELQMDEGRVDARLLNVGLSPCWHLGRLIPCASLEVGNLRARGFAPLEDPKTVNRAFLAAGLRVFVWDFKLDFLAARWFVDGQATLLKTRILVGETGAWQSPGFRASTGIHVSLRLL
ncbi:MAG: hypothetical protein GY811_02655 [Myxococcales bacterium]|nr:hypothetical protein [Myxococcales bacterium]